MLLTSFQHLRLAAPIARHALARIPCSCVKSPGVSWARNISLYTAPPVKLPPGKASVAKHAGPSKAYLSASLIATPPLQSTRKLLVLDLNGCLVHRGSGSGLDGGNPGKRKRICYPRPYMEPFRNYLFHPEIRAWLDVMVWSAAQPHNVTEMVDSCFGEDRTNLVEVWARDRMQLQKRDYHKKATVYKDLTSVWSQVSFPNPHSQYTTILLDDSVGKSAYQPCNHVIVKEYLGNPRPWESHAIPHPVSADNELSPLERARSLTPPEKSESEFDQTLLAVIGILDAVRDQRNVSYWIRAGGLMLRNSMSPDHDVSTEAWFRTASIANHWEARGTQVLRDLGLEITPGVGPMS